MVPGVDLAPELENVLQQTPGFAGVPELAIEKAEHFELSRQRLALQPFTHTSFTTNEELAGNVLSEIGTPIEEIEQRVDQMSQTGLEDPVRQAELEQIQVSVREIRRRIDACRRGPRTILGAEQELQRHQVDPAMADRRILIADNEGEIRETMERILTQRGCEVVVCPDGGTTIEAIAASERSGTPYELIISDIKMPDRNGYEIFRAAKAVSAATPVILMTGFGYDPHHSIIRASQEGLQALLFKPFKASQLIDAIKKAWETEAEETESDGAPKPTGPSAGRRRSVEDSSD